MKPRRCRRLRGLRVTVPQAVTHVLLGWRSSPLHLHPPPHHHHLLALSHSAGEEHALFLCAPQPPCSCPLTVSLQYFSIPITGTVGDPLPFNVAASHPGVTTCQGTLSLWPQLLSPSRLRNANPFLLIHEAPRSCLGICVYMCHKVLNTNVRALAGAAADICMCKFKYAFSFFFFFLL